MGRLTKDKRDIYYRKAKEQGFRARSAYKLLHINDSFHILEDVTRVVDLCAAPGSWSQVLARVVGVRPNAKIVAVDLQRMAPIKGVIQIQGDITQKNTAFEIIRHFDGGKADIVVSDGAPDVTGMHDLDEYIQGQLILAALNITTFVLKKGGTFVAKIFRGKNASLLYAKLQIFFSNVQVVKPKSSRNSSIEAFVLCRDYQPPEGYEPRMTPLNFDVKDFDNLTGVNRVVVPFLTCGDLSGFDSDMNYPPTMDENGKIQVLPPVQEPLASPEYTSASLAKKTLKHNLSERETSRSPELPLFKKRPSVGMLDGSRDSQELLILDLPVAEKRLANGPCRGIQQVLTRRLSDDDRSSASRLVTAEKKEEVIEEKESYSKAMVVDWVSRTAVLFFILGSSSLIVSKLRRFVN